MLKEIQYLDYLMKTKDFAAASQKAGLSEAQFRQELKEWENQLGFQLFDPPESVILSVPGYYFYANTTLITRDLHRVLKEAQAIAHEPEENVLRIGSHYALDSKALAYLLQQLQDQLPQLEIQHQRSHPYELENLLRHNEVDVLITSRLPEPADPFAAAKPFKACRHVLISKNHELASRTMIHAAQIQDLTGAVVGPEIVDAGIKKDLQENGYPKQIVFYDSLEQAAAKLAGQPQILFKDLIPGFGLEAEDYTAVPFTLNGSAYENSYWLVWKKDNPSRQPRILADLLEQLSATPGTEQSSPQKK